MGIVLRTTQVMIMLLLLPATAVARPILFVCRNPVSGASWNITVDFDKHVADGNTARISDSEISWKDSGGTHYTLNRKSGELTEVTPSSTGGYFLHDRCKLN